MSSQEVSSLGYLGDSVSVRKLNVYGANLQNIGSVTSANATVSEAGDAKVHYTTITLKNGVTLSPAGAANLAFGKQLYTFPSGKIAVVSAVIDVKLQGGGVVDADTPDVGLGSVVASGAVALLSGTATFENILTGQTATNCSGTAIKAVRQEGYGATTASSVYLNVADGWAGADTLTLSGTVILQWVYLGA